MREKIKAIDYHNHELQEKIEVLEKQIMQIEQEYLSL